MRWRRPARSASGARALRGQNPRCSRWFSSGGSSGLSAARRRTGWTTARCFTGRVRLGVRRWGWLGLAAALVFPSAAQAAGPQVRLLNAAVSGKVTIQLDGKTEFSRVKLGRTTRRHTVRAGRHVLTATVGKGKAKKVIARLGATLKKGQRLTIVYAVKGHRPSLFLFA